MTPPAPAPGFRLRAAATADLPAVLALLESAGLAPLGIERGFGPTYVLAVAPDGGLVGCAGIERYGEDGLLRSVAVAPRHQRGGVGRRLTEDRLDYARQHGIATLWLLTEGAAGYWARHGFSPVARDAAPEAIRASHEWQGGCPASAVAMRLALSPVVAR